MPIKPGQAVATAATVVAGRVVGRVLMQENSVGIADLVVGLWEMNVPQGEEHHWHQGAGTPGRNRLVAGFTGRLGDFELAVPASHAKTDRRREGQRGLLQLTVEGPSDTACRAPNAPLPCEPPPVLHCTLVRYPSPGGTEAVVVRLPRDLLAQHGLLPRARDLSGEMEATWARGREAAQLSNKRRKEIEDHRSKFREKVRAKVQEALASRFKPVAGRLYASTNEPLVETMRKAARRGLERTSRQVSPPRVTFTPAQIQRLGGDPGSLDKEFECRLTELIEMIQSIHPGPIQTAAESAADVQTVLDSIEAQLFGRDDDGTTA